MFEYIEVETVVIILVFIIMFTVSKILIEIIRLLRSLEYKTMIPNFIFIGYVIGWAKALEYGIESSSYLISLVMVLPFLVIIIPVLLFGLRPSNGFLVLSLNSTDHAAISPLLTGSLLTSGSIFFFVIYGSSNVINIATTASLIIIGSCFTVYAHKHKVKPKILL